MEQLKGLNLRKLDEEIIKEKVSNNKIINFLTLLDSTSLDALSYVNSIERFLNKVGLNIKKFDVNNENELTEFETEIKIDNPLNCYLIAKPLKKEIIQRLEVNINPNSDPDMFTLLNKGKLYFGDLTRVPATAKAVLRLLDFYNIPLEGKRALVIGRSENVGLPLALGLMRKNAFVQIAHSKISREEINRQAKDSDLLILASGQKCLIDENSIHSNQVIIDCGYHGDTKDGDLGFVPNMDLKGFYTPVPGGVGPLTISTLIMNAYEIKGM